MDTSFNIRVRKIEDWMFFYDCKDSGCSNSNQVALIFLKHNGVCGWAISNSQLWYVDSTSEQKQLTIFTIHGPLMIKSLLKPVSTLQLKIILSNQFNFLYACKPNLTSIYHTEIIFQWINKLFSTHVCIIYT